MLDVTWLLFIAASLVLIVTPGQDMILVMSRSLTQGSAAGVATATGVSVGLVGHADGRCPPRAVREPGKQIRATMRQHTLQERS